MAVLRRSGLTWGTLSAAVIAIAIASCSSDGAVSSQSTVPTPTVEASTITAAATSTSLEEPAQEDEDAKAELSTSPLPAMELPDSWALLPVYGRLRVEGNCVYLDTSDGRVLTPLWLDGYAALGVDTIHYTEYQFEAAGSRPYANGAEVVVSGGPFSRISIVREVPNECGDHEYQPIVSMRLGQPTP